MPYYRLYKLDPQSGHIDGAEDFHASDDVAAVHYVQLCSYSIPVEIWQGNRKVSRVDATPEATPYAPRSDPLTLN